MTADLLQYRAGPRALRRLRRDGLTKGSIRAVFGPASGPRWLVLAGLDRALLESGLLQPQPLTDERILLAGSSAGSWRMLAFACRDPGRTHQRLLDRYIGQAFSQRDTPRTIRRAYQEMLTDLLADEASYILSHPHFDLGIHTARARLGGSRVALIAAILAAGPLSLWTHRATGLFFERVVFHSCPERFQTARFQTTFAGRIVALDHHNLIPAAQASGAVPVYVEAINNISGAPSGSYVDGGLTDYHLNQTYFAADRGIILLPHYTQRLLPRWLDRLRPSRSPTHEMVADLLQLYPSPELLSLLPDQQLPDRDDFKRFLTNPTERIRRWRDAISATEVLGEQFLADLESGRISDRVRPLSTPP